MVSHKNVFPGNFLNKSSPVTTKHDGPQKLFQQIPGKSKNNIPVEK
jgi:hypothetical protein